MKTLGLDNIISVLNYVSDATLKTRKNKKNEVTKLTSDVLSCGEYSLAIIIFLFSIRYSRVGLLVINKQKL